MATAKHQFAYRKRFPATKENKAIVEHVLRLWEAEKKGAKISRSLPKRYKYFAAYRGKNRYRSKYRSRDYYIPRG